MEVDPPCRLGIGPTVHRQGGKVGLTTFSTWMIETIRLGIPPLRTRALFNLTITLIAGVALTAAGYSLTN